VVAEYLLESMSTIGASRLSEAPMSVIGATPDAVRSAPGSTVRIGPPGEKPSLRSQAAGSRWTPAALAGIIAAVNATRSPVRLSASRTA